MCDTVSNPSMVIVEQEKQLLQLGVTAKGGNTLAYLVYEFKRQP